MREGGDCYLLIFKIFQLNIRLVKGGKEFIKVKVKFYHSLSHLLPHQAREASPSSSPGYFSRHLRFLKDILLFPECQKKKYLYQETHIAGKKCRAGDIMKGTIKDLSLMSKN